MTRGSASASGGDVTDVDHGRRPRRITIIRDPQVYLVGRQTIDEAALAALPRRPRASSRWTTDTEVAGEKLVEVAGRLCYKSLRQAPARRQRGVHRPHPRGRPRLGARARRLQLHHHRREPVVHPRAGPTPGRVGLFASSASGSSTRRIARSSSPTRSPRTPSCTGSGSRRSRRASRPIARWPTGLTREVRGHRGQDPPPQEGPRGGAERPAQRDRDPDLRHRQRPGPPPLHRDARRRRGRRRDPQGRRRDPQDPPGRRARTSSATTRSSTSPEGGQTAVTQHRKV